MKKDPLFRKINTTAHGSICKNKRAKYDRNTKKGISQKMGSNHKHGYDYTPLVRFLLSKIGSHWDEIYSEISKRSIDKKILSLFVSFRKENIPQFDGKIVPYIRISDSSYWSAMFFDDNNILQLVDPNLKKDDIPIWCKCCTHTFNGKNI
jgi:hypothetical protein